MYSWFCFTVVAQYRIAQWYAVLARSTCMNVTLKEGHETWKIYKDDVKLYTNMQKKKKKNIHIQYKQKI